MTDSKKVKDLVERAKQVAQKDPKLADVVGRFIVSMAENAASQHGEIRIKLTTPPGADFKILSRNPSQVASIYVKQIKQAKSIKEVRRLEAKALKEIEAARQGREVI